MTAQERAQARHERRVHRRLRRLIPLAVENPGNPGWFWRIANLANQLNPDECQDALALYGELSNERAEQLAREQD